MKKNLNQKPQYRKYLPGLLLFFAILLICGLYLHHMNTHSPDTANASPVKDLQTRPLSEPLAFNNPDGTEHTIQKPLPQITVVHFWATWCGYCVQELPDLHQLMQEYQGKVTFVFADLLDGTRETPEGVQAFLQKQNLQDLPVVYDEKGVNFSKLGLQGLPTTLILNQQGELLPLGRLGSDQEIRYAFPGRIPTPMLRSMLNQALKLYSEDPAASSETKREPQS